MTKWVVKVAWGLSFPRTRAVLIRILHHDKRRTDIQKWTAAAAERTSLSTDREHWLTLQMQSKTNSHIRFIVTYVRLLFGQINLQPDHMVVKRVLRCRFDRTQHVLSTPDTSATTESRRSRSAASGAERGATTVRISCCRLPCSTPPTTV